MQSLLFVFSRVDAVIDPVLVRCTAPEWCAPGLVLDGGCVEGNRGPVSLLVLDALPSPWFYILRPNGSPIVVGFYDCEKIAVIVGGCMGPNDVGTSGR